MFDADLKKGLLVSERSRALECTFLSNALCTKCVNATEHASSVMLVKISKMAMFVDTYTYENKY